MAHEKYQTCIDACYTCAAACDHCATACLTEPDPGSMADCIKADLDVADACRSAAAAMARGSDYVKEICGACASLCEKCADVCDKYEADHCKKCAQACRDCAAECRKMAA
jgi:hypothetical protein